MQYRIQSLCRHKKDVILHWKHYMKYNYQSVCRDIQDVIGQIPS